jgi:hypothetical protein
VGAVIPLLSQQHINELLNFAAPRFSDGAL